MANTENPKGYPHPDKDDPRLRDRGPETFDFKKGEREPDPARDAAEADDAPTEEVPWRRMDSALWEVTQPGDIWKSYSGQSLNERGRVSEPFKHDGKLWAAIGATTGGRSPATARAHRLYHPEDFPGRVRPEGAAGFRGIWSYYGRSAFWRSHAVILGEALEFVAAPMTQPEMRVRVRHQYAHGGWTASQSKNYEEFLRRWINRQITEDPINPDHLAALEAEYEERRDLLPMDCAALLAYLGVEPRHNAAEEEQPALIEVGQSEFKL